MIRAFQILAAALLVAAAYFLFRGDYDDAFVTAVLSVCSFFLSIRFTFKPRVDERLETRGREQADADKETAEESTAE